MPGSDDNDHAPRDKAIKLDKTGCLAGPSDAEQKDLAPFARVLEREKGRALKKT